MTDITELAQRARINDECGEHLSPAETMELVEALESEKRICATWRKTAEANSEKLEKAQTINAAAEKLVRCKGRYHSEQNYRALAALFGVKTPDLPPLEHENVHYADAAEMEIAALRQRIAELERQNSVLADGVIRAEQWLLESRTVTDWIEHDGKWRPESLGLDELVYLKTRKQELKIPYPAGKVLGWMHTGGDMDVMAYKLASPQARTVTVKLPELCVGVVQDGHAVMVPYPAGHWFNKTAILEMLAGAGIKVEAE